MYVHSDAYAFGKGIKALFHYWIEAISGAAPEAETDVDGGDAGLVGDGEAMTLAAAAACLEKKLRPKSLLKFSQNGFGRRKPGHNDYPWA